ncbi:hypothetical protein HYH02_012811 [Chlamydomonas schloesseri]|uniref:guanylate cyclase n=1 Tax=Chlamydomonas schloesseri TaxID=2026947 RepID=A0A835W0W5_9CHLO|nr:hypothetical protein HYH02_012811 [Chlamydomonas schloesseri]|eukprot:KAG2433108.1 hypothetical protein HYH02_012811 [Chlamydomonas schloesseri]
MIGIINEAAKLFVLDTYGQETWDAIVASTGCDPHFISGCPYADEQTYKILGAVAEMKGEAPGDVLEAAGLHFNTVYVVKRGYDRLLRCMGGNLVEFLQNLNVYHLHLSVTFKEMNPPFFNVSEVTPQSLIFHYASQRPGLTRYAMGLLRGAARTLFDTEVQVTVLQLRDEPGSSSSSNAAAAAAAAGADPHGAAPGRSRVSASGALASALGLAVALDGAAGAATSYPRDSESGEYGELRTSTPRAGTAPPPPAPPAPPLDYDKLLVTFPHQPSVHHHAATASSCRLSIDPATLFKLFPFHIAFDSECRIVQVGRALLRMYPGMKPGRRLTDFFTLRHPYFDICFERIKERLDSVFVLKARSNGMELKGQMTHMLMPAGRGDHNPARSYSRTVVPPTGLEVIHSALARLQEAAAATAATAATSGGSHTGYFGDSAGGSLTGSFACPHMSALAQQRQQQQPQQQPQPPSQWQGKGPSSQAPPPQPLHPLAPSAAREALNTAGTGTGTGPGSAYLATHGTYGTGTGGGLASAGGGGGGGNGGLLFSRTSSFGSLGGAGHCDPLGGGGGGGGGGGLEPVMLFLGSPRIGNVDELRTYGLYVSDLPLFDNSREMILSMEQRTAEAALKDSFERLSLQLEEERHRTQQLLYQMIPRRIADVLRSGERFEAETYPSATILFSDIVGFTTISAGSTAMEVCNMLDELYNEFDALLESDKYKALYKVETIGDAYMLVANVTELCEEHVDVMCDFALDMHRVCGRVKTNKGQPLQIRVGIHTGSVVGGIVGRRMPRFHLFGDTVNTASRMESHGVPGAVHISSASRQLLRHPQDYLITERGEIAVKGKGLMETFLVSRADNPTTAHIRAIVAESAEKLPCLNLGPGASATAAAAATARLLPAYPLPASAQPRVRRAGSFITRGSKSALGPSPAAHMVAALALQAHGSHARLDHGHAAGASASVSAAANVQDLPPLSPEQLQQLQALQAQALLLQQQQQQQQQGLQQGLQVLSSHGGSGPDLAGLGLYVLCGHGGGDGSVGDTGGAMSPAGMLSPRGGPAALAALHPSPGTHAAQAAATAAAVAAAQQAHAVYAAAAAAAAAAAVGGGGGSTGPAAAPSAMAVLGSPAAAFGGTFSVGRPRQAAAALQGGGEVPCSYPGATAPAAAVAAAAVAGPAGAAGPPAAAAGAPWGAAIVVPPAVAVGSAAVGSTVMSPRSASTSPFNTHNGMSGPHPAQQQQQQQHQHQHQQQPDLLQLLPTLHVQLPTTSGLVAGPGTSRFAPSGSTTPPLVGTAPAVGTRASVGGAAAGGGGGLTSAAEASALALGSGPGTPTAEADGNLWRVGPSDFPTAHPVDAAAAAAAAAAAPSKPGTASGAGPAGSSNVGAMSPLLVDQSWDGLLQGLAGLDEASREEVSAAAAATAAAAAAWRQQQQNLKQRLRRILTQPELPTSPAAAGAVAAVDAGGATAPGCDATGMPAANGGGGGTNGGGAHGGTRDGGGGAAAAAAAAGGAAAGLHARAHTGLLSPGCPGAATPPWQGSPGGSAVGSQARRRMARARKQSFVLADSPAAASGSGGGIVEQSLLELVEADVLQLLAGGPAALSPAAAAAWARQQQLAPPPPAMQHDQQQEQQRQEQQEQQQEQQHMWQQHMWQQQQLQQAAASHPAEAGGTSLSFQLPPMAHSPAAPFLPRGAAGPSAAATGDRGGDGRAQYLSAHEEWFGDALEEAADDDSHEFHARHRLARRHLTDDLSDDEDAQEYEI